MKYIVILLLAKDPIYVPFDTTLDCYEQGKEVIEAVATYYKETENKSQGWYTKKDDLIFGFYCK